MVGVNFAGSDEDSLFFAVNQDVAVPFAEQLAGGQDVDSIGINGLAFDDGDDWFGIWVVAVKSGSPADQAGLQPGDVIYRMEGIGLAGDGTMRDYCDILRSHRPATPSNSTLCVAANTTWGRSMGGRSIRNPQ